MTNKKIQLKLDKLKKENKLKELNVLEKALMCNNVYLNTIDDYLEKIKEEKISYLPSYIKRLFYFEIYKFFNIKADMFVNVDSGFYSGLYFNSRIDEYVLVFRGTEGKKRIDGKLYQEAIKDWNKGNIPQLLGKESLQYEAAKRLIKEMDGKVKNYSITGHSLGGGLAATSFLVVKKKGTITFNSAGLHRNTIKKINSKKYITNYFVEGEVVTMSQRFGKLLLTILSPLVGPLALFILPNAAGKFKKIKQTEKYKSPIQRHQMTQVIKNLIKD